MESQYHAAGIEGILVSFSPSHKSHACRQKIYTRAYLVSYIPLKFVSWMGKSNKLQHTRA